MNTFIYKSIVAMGCIYSGYIYAACVQNPTWQNIQKTIPNETISIQYDDTRSYQLKSISLPIYSGKYDTTDGVSRDCGGNQVGIYLAPVSNGMAVSGINGIGIKAGINTFGPNTFFPVNGPYTDTSWVFTDPKWNISIQKTGLVTSGGIISTRQLARFYQQNKKTGTNFYISTVSFSTNYRINVLSCSLKNSVPIIKLGDWYDTQFPAIGSTSTDVDIPITLSCKAGTNIKATVTATSGTVNATQGQLALSGTNKATGVAIQLIDANKTPIPLGTKRTIKNNVSAGDYIFGWKARYIKTADKVTPGSANGTATVNIRYE